jgi:hypothetical protein
MNSDGDKIYMKLVAFDGIYNFVVQSFLIRSHLEARRNDILPRSGILQMQKQFKIKSYRSHRKLQFSYKFYLHPINDFLKTN